MNVIGLDISSTRTGVAAVDFDTGDLTATHVVKVSTPVGMIGRQERIHKMVSGVVAHVIDLSHHGVSGIWIEHAHYARADAAAVLNMVQGGILERLFGHGHPVSIYRLKTEYEHRPGKKPKRKLPQMGVNAAAIKIHATGFGDATKDDMIDAARRRWGVDLTDDEADAAWLASWGRIRDAATLDLDLDEEAV